jgi:neurotransmitter:Na+ symporter, NSS family
MAAMGGGGGGAPPERGEWGSRLGFILAAAGSAVGLGNIWGFPFAAAENGGGLFVLAYLVFVAAIGLPVMIAEVMIGRRAQRAPVGAFGRLSGDRLMWKLVGWMGVAAGFLILSFYSVIAGWTLDYTLLSVAGGFDGRGAEEIAALFGERTGAPIRVVVLHAVFMALTVGIVIGGVRGGLERSVRVLMPTLFVLILGLVGYGMTLDGFGEGVRFMFVPEAGAFDGEAALASLGQAFFSLSLGMGALITYGSYLRQKDDIVAASATISVLDTTIAISAGLILFPIAFTFAVPVGEGGAGFIFAVLPLAFTEMPAGNLIAVVFFALLLFAALTSAISLLEVVTSTVIDQLEWSRRKATLVVAAAIFAVGVPTAIGARLPFGEMSFLDGLYFLTSNIFLPLGGLMIAIFAGWVLSRSVTREEFLAGTKLGGLYAGWLVLVRYVVPIAILIVFLSSIGLI